MAHEREQLRNTGASPSGKPRAQVPRLCGEQDLGRPLDEERFDTVANAALETFAREGYKGASTEQIARKAGMSKGLLFFYFRNKRELYLRTLDWLYEKTVSIVIDEHFWEIDDFFELMQYAARSKAHIMRRYPWALEFCLRAYYPQHRDVADTLNRWNTQVIEQTTSTFMKNVDWSRFRPEVSPQQALNMLIWLADGWTHAHLAAEKPIDIDELLSDFESMCDMVRCWAYKPEFQHPAPQEAGPVPQP